MLIITALLRAISTIDFDYRYQLWVSLKAPADGSQDALLDIAVTRGLSQIVKLLLEGILY